jgi:hypothetical protein
MDFHLGDKIEFDFGGWHDDDVHVHQIGSSTEISAGGVDVFLVGYHGPVPSGSFWA